jgi:hypothetical protein
MIRKLQMKNLAFDGMFSGELLFDWSCLPKYKKTVFQQKMAVTICDGKTIRKKVEVEVEV